MLLTFGDRGILSESEIYGLPVTCWADSRDDGTKQSPLTGDPCPRALVPGVPAEARAASRGWGDDLRIELPQTFGSLGGAEVSQVDISPSRSYCRTA